MSNITVLKESIILNNTKEMELSSNLLRVMLW